MLSRFSLFLKKAIFIIYSFFVLFALTGSTNDRPTTFFNVVDDFMRMYVKDGYVDYRAIKRNKKELDKIVKVIEVYDVKSCSDTERKAFYINAYNVLVVSEVIKRYPVKSVMDIKGFFDQNKLTVAGEKLTLNDIENKKLREQYKDARIHFALVCAAKGCPRIIPMAYYPKKLEEQLEERAVKTLNDKYFIRVNDKENTVQVFEIFKWYENDFLNEANSLLQYINKYRETKIPKDFKVSYHQYDWSLNSI